MTEDARMTQERVAHLASELETSRTECTSLRGERDATRFTLESVRSAAKDEVDALRDSLRSERGRVEEARTRLASVDALKARNSKLEDARAGPIGSVKGRVRGRAAVQGARAGCGVLRGFDQRCVYFYFRTGNWMC